MMSSCIYPQAGADWGQKVALDILVQSGNTPHHKWVAYSWHTRMYYAKDWPTLYSGPPGKLPVLQMASPPLPSGHSKPVWLSFFCINIILLHKVDIYKNTSNSFGEHWIPLHGHKKRTLGTFVYFFDPKCKLTFAYNWVILIFVSEEIFNSKIRKHKKKKTVPANPGLPFSDKTSSNWAKRCRFL